MGDVSQVLAETARISSLGNLLLRGGFPELRFRSLLDIIIVLLRETAKGLRNHTTVLTLIIRHFNTASFSNSIVSLLRLLASAWIKAHRARYQDIIPSAMQIEDYRKSILENPLDGFGMGILVDVLMKPAGISVKIWSLDPSEDMQINSPSSESMGRCGSSLSMESSVTYIMHWKVHPSCINGYYILYRDISSVKQDSNMQTILIPGLLLSSGLPPIYAEPRTKLPVTNELVFRVTAARQQQIVSTSFT